MTKYILFLIVLLMFLSLVYSAPLICSTDQWVDNPQNINQVGDNTPYARFFSKTNFEGDQVGMRPGEVFIDDLDEKWKKSIKISPQHELLLFQKVHLGGSHVVIDADVPDLTNFLGFVPGSFWYREKTTDPRIFPVIYASPSFKGKETVVQFGTTVFTELPELPFFGSLKVPAGMTVTLTTAIGPRSSKSYDITSDTSELPFSDPVKSVSVRVNLSGEF
jgi:hypothetical protein